VISQQELKDLLHYNPLTGLFTWKVSRGGFATKGNVCETLESKGYIQIKIKGVLNMAHRLVYLYLFGFIPEQVNHKNGIRNDNRLINLEISNQKHNMRRKFKYKTNKSGVIGVHRRGNKFIGQISNEEMKRLYFASNDLFEVIAWRKSKELELDYKHKGD
jgi:hypothetical protein